MKTFAGLFVYTSIIYILVHACKCTSTAVWVYMVATGPILIGEWRVMLLRLLRWCYSVMFNVRCITAYFKQVLKANGHADIDFAGCVSVRMQVRKGDLVNGRYIIYIRVYLYIICTIVYNILHKRDEWADNIVCIEIHKYTLYIIYLALAPPTQRSSWCGLFGLGL